MGALSWRPTSPSARTCGSRPPSRDRRPQRDDPRVHIPARWPLRPRHVITTGADGRPPRAGTGGTENWVKRTISEKVQHEAIQGR
jgi:hypothetical protein